MHTIDHTQDEFGEDKFFVADKNGDWVGEPHATIEAAREERLRLDGYSRLLCSYLLTRGHGGTGRLNELGVCVDCGRQTLSGSYEARVQDLVHDAFGVPPLYDRQQDTLDEEGLPR